VLRGIFMLRRAELEWFYQKGCDMLYPDAWEKYLAAIPEAEHGDLIMAYHKRLTSDDPEVRLAAARAWSVWEASTSFLFQNDGYIAASAGDEFALAFAGIENHYFVIKGFFDADDQLLRDVPKMAHIPGVIVHGRYDVVCPVQNAFDLHAAWPKSELRVSPEAGHSAFEAQNIDALVRATDRFAG
jgi:proline iminopeptidase